MEFGAVGICGKCKFSTLTFAYLDYKFVILHPISEPSSEQVL